MPVEVLQCSKWLEYLAKPLFLFLLYLFYSLVYFFFGSFPFLFFFSILFFSSLLISSTGEEQGFFGSKKYVQGMFVSDLIPSFMLNMDMISLDPLIIIETREVQTITIITLTKIMMITKVYWLYYFINIINNSKVWWIYGRNWQRRIHWFPKSS